ncbi:DNA-binding response regulator [Halobacteriovorax marinus]|uniref:Two-component response regulator n=1 Tax=Halobacteriovorax marinus (strain ATCC BAA-682 / DSM 15412 / SJ) TaxID=862908 RepID=E1X1T4_HALMS|nr:response regulator transcription factor [Halobacteriovorax marinus]ATH07951.1 DNA-binding response regulator [Halobacteriovorax marinus]CBW26594.1 two-component response regulator [Halobacteriovorax marinus SJ]
MMKSKILVVDDSEDIRILVQKVLGDKYILEMAQNSEEALTKAIEFSPDLILLDIMMPDTSGYEICSQIKSRDEMKNTPIIFLSSKTGSNSRVTGYKLGAIQYIEKPFETEELKEVVNSVLRNVSRTDQNEIQNYEDITLNIPSQEVVVIGERVHFTSSEFKIIHLLLKNTNRVLSREKILNHIAPGNFSANDRMIDTYISALRRKIKKSNFQIKSVYGEGYKIIASA